MPSQFKPARDTRHRKACFSLFRALLRQGRLVPLPDDIATGLGPRNPILSLIHGGFRRNRHDSSPRLVVSALKNGYRFLTLLHAASQTATASSYSPALPSPAHSEVLAFLRDHQSRVLAWRATAVPPISTGPGPDLIPLLTRVREGTQYSPPVYEATNRPLPLSELKGGVRRVPRLDDAHGVPFLRLKKPQSPVLSAFLGRKLRRRQKRIQAMLSLVNEGMVGAAEEDLWDSLVEEQLRRQAPGQWSNTNVERETTYQDWVRMAARELSFSLNCELDDMVARGKAMWKLVEAEKALAKKEAREKRRKEMAERAERAKGESRGRNETGEGGVAREDPFQRLQITAEVDDGNRRKPRTRRRIHRLRTKALSDSSAGAIPDNKGEASKPP